MRYILAFLLLSFIVAAFLFQSQTHNNQGDPSDYIDSKDDEIKTVDKIVPTKETEVVVDDGVSQSLIVEEVKEVINYKDEENQDKVEVNNKKKKKKPIKYTISENKEKLISSKLGDYYIQDHLQVISAQGYNASQGKILAKSAGYYFIATPKGETTKSFPIVVKKKNKKTLKLMTGIISIKSDSLNTVTEIAKQYSLEKIQFFSHLNLYIYKIASPSNIIEVFNNIQKSPGVNQATLEILNKRVVKL